MNTLSILVKEASSFVRNHSTVFVLRGELKVDDPTLIPSCAFKGLTGWDEGTLVLDTINFRLPDLSLAELALAKPGTWLNIEYEYVKDGHFSFWAFKSVSNPAITPAGALDVHKGPGF